MEWGGGEGVLEVTVTTGLGVRLAGSGVRNRWWVWFGGGLELGDAVVAGERTEIMCICSH